MPHRRLQSLDAFRGLTIAAMILVNNPAGEIHRYRLLRHAAWNGCRPADVIFPAFLFIAGVSIALSLEGRRGGGAGTTMLLANVFRRAVLLFALGLLLNALPYFDWEIVRVPGVLQRIAIAYLFASLIALRWGPTGQVAWMLALLLVYAGALLFVPVPGFGAGVLEPGSDLASYVDRALLGTHMAHRDWDPEGLLSSLPAVSSVLAGTLAGHWMLARTAREVPFGLVAGGLSAAAVGLVLGLWLPVNKSLWTSSYVLLTAGISALALALCFWIVDVRGWAAWTLPFLVLGTNPIVAYWLSSFVGKLMELVQVTRADGSSIFLETAVVDGLQQLTVSRPLASLTYSLVYTALWIAALAPLFRRRVFIKI